MGSVISTLLGAATVICMGLFYKQPGLSYLGMVIVSAFLLSKYFQLIHISEEREGILLTMGAVLWPISLIVICIYESIKFYERYIK